MLGAVTDSKQSKSIPLMRKVVAMRVSNAGVSLVVAGFELGLNILKPPHTRGFGALVTNVLALGDVVVKANCNQIDCHNQNKDVLQDPPNGVPEKHLLEELNNGEPKQLPEESCNEEVPPSLRVVARASRDHWAEESAPSINQSFNSLDHLTATSFSLEVATSWGFLSFDNAF
jgi:hypothetical protein